MTTPEPNRPVPRSRAHRYALAAIFLFALASRGLLALMREPGPVGDEVSYLNCAENIARGNGFVFTRPDYSLHLFLPPGYTAFLAPFVKIFGAGTTPRAAALAQAFLGAGTALLAAATARRLAGNDAGIIAATAVAVHPYFIYYTSRLLTEPLALFLFGLFLYLYLDEDAGLPRLAAAGAVMSLATLTRPTFLYLGVLAWAVLLIDGKGAPFRRRLGRAAVAALAFVVVLAPWTVRNHERSGRVVVVNYVAGTALYQKNRFLEATAPRLWDVDKTAAYNAYIARIPANDVARELARQDFLRARAAELIRAHKLGYVKLSAARFAHMWSFYPEVAPWTPVTPRIIAGLVVAAAYSAFLFAAAVVGLVVLRPRRAKLALPALALALVGIHSLTIALLRYRLPTDLILAILAGAGGAFVWDKIKTRRRAARAAS